MARLPGDCIKQVFDRRFAAWDIRLPADFAVSSGGGTIAKRCCTINYHYTKTDGKPCLDYFTSHRMTNDTLNRIHADGREELLGYCQEFYLSNNKEAERAYHQPNQEFYEDVKRRGLLHSANQRR